MINISLQAKSALTILTLYHSPVEEHQEYVKDITLLPPYHLTPEICEELFKNGLINQQNIPTSAGIWFTYNCGLSDAPPAFDRLVRSLSTKARHTLALFCIGELAQEHTTTKNPVKKNEIERFLSIIERFLTGTTLKKVGQIEKSMSNIAQDYLKIIQFNVKRRK